MRWAPTHPHLPRLRVGLGWNEARLTPPRSAVCWQIVEAEALESLDALQRDDDAELSARATRLFQGLVPRIWAF